MHMRETNPLSGSDTRRAIAANVRVELARANISGAEMARRIGMPLSSCARRLAGEVSFSAEEIVTVAAELGIAPAVLLPPAPAPLAAVPA
jgi:hypothetical protein